MEYCYCSSRSAVVQIKAPDSSGQLTFSNNHLSGNTGNISFLLLWESTPGSLTFENNTFDDTATTYAFQPPRTNFSPPSVDVTNNWWGTTNNTELQTLMYDWNDDLVYREVDYTPFLTTPSTSTPPSPPQNVAAQTGPTSIQLAWSANSESDISGYKVYHDTDAAGQFGQVGASRGGGRGCRHPYQRRVHYRRPGRLAQDPAPRPHGLSGLHLCQ